MAQHTYQKHANGKQTDSQSELMTESFHPVVQPTWK